MSARRVKNWMALPLAIAASCASMIGAAYETDTHAKITNSAFQISNLGASPALLQGLGLDLRVLDPDPSAPFGFTYFDVSDDQVTTRETFNYYEAIPINALTSDSGFYLQDWIMRGAIREDDLGYHLDGTPDGSDPHDEADPIYRVFNHFYDPVNDAPLNSPYLSQLKTVFFASPIPLVVDSFFNPLKAPDWAIGAQDSFADPNTPLDPRANHFTIFDAREAMYRALTLQAEVAGATPPVSIFDPNTTLEFDPNLFTTMETTRLKYWATAFRALGDVLHLNQDMAQPQHTRNEPHTGTFESQSFGVSSVFVGHQSVYEQYINARVENQPVFLLDTINEKVTIGTSLPITIYDGQYPIPNFTHYTDYWSTAKQGSVSSGVGLADYSNRGFFTASNNLNLLGNYSLPTSNPFAYDKVLTAPTDWTGAPITGFASPIILFYGTVPETASSATGPATGVPLTSFGLWDNFMTSQSLTPSYTLNRINYDAMASLLLPRAVAYSAGLINYFFRGSMAITPPHEGVFGIIDHSTQYNNTGRVTDPDSRTQGFGTIKLTLTNTSPATETMSGGVLTAVLKFRRNREYLDDLTHEPGAPGEDFDALRGTVEEIVTSTATLDHTGTPITTASLAQGVPQEFGFNFYQVLPLNATDVTLQVIYRGVLGSEKDAIVVGTINLSEPTYFSYINAFDFIHIGGSVYTFAEVNNSASLLAQVAPPSCIVGQQSPPPVGSLNPNCFSPNQTLSIGLDATHPTTNPLINVQNMPARHYFRVAMLTAGGSSGQVVLQQDSICMPSTPFTVPGLINAHLAVVGTTGSTVSIESSDLSSERGILGWFGTSCVYDGDNSPAGAVDNRVTKWAQSSEATGPLGPTGGGSSDELFPYPVTKINFPQYDSP